MQPGRRVQSSHLDQRLAEHLSEQAFRRPAEHTSKTLSATPPAIGITPQLACLAHDCYDRTWINWPLQIADLPIDGMAVAPRTRCSIATVR